MYLTIRKDAEKKEVSEMEIKRMVELVLSSEDFYDENIEVLALKINNDGSMLGDFRDLENQRVFKFVIDGQDVSYKPRIKGRKDSNNWDDERILKQWEIESLVYLKRFPKPRFDARKKRGVMSKKPKCTGISYNCGKRCLGVDLNCRISKRDNRSKQRLENLQELAKKYKAGDAGPFYAGSEKKAQEVEAMRKTAYEESLKRRESAREKRRGEKGKNDIKSKPSQEEVKQRFLREMEESRKRREEQEKVNVARQEKLSNWIDNAPDLPKKPEQLNLYKLDKDNNETYQKVDGYKYGDNFGVYSDGKKHFAIHLASGKRMTDEGYQSEKEAENTIKMLEQTGIDFASKKDVSDFSREEIDLGLPAIKYYSKWSEPNYSNAKWVDDLPDLSSSPRQKQKSDRSTPELSPMAQKGKELVEKRKEEKPTSVEKWKKDNKIQDDDISKPLTGGNKEGYLGRTVASTDFANNPDAKRYVEYAVRKASPEESRAADKGGSFNYMVESRVVQVDPPYAKTGWEGSVDAGNWDLVLGGSDLSTAKSNLAEYLGSNKKLKSFASGDEELGSLKDNLVAKEAEKRQKSKELKEKKSLEEETTRKLNEEGKKSFTKWIDSQPNVKGKNAEFTIRTGQGEETRQGTTFDGKIGISKDDQGHVLTHLKSGYRIAGDKTTSINAARTMTKALLNSGIDLDKDVKDFSYEDREKLVAIKQAVTSGDYQAWSEVEQNIAKKSPELSPLAQKGKELVEKRKEEKLTSVEKWKKDNKIQDNDPTIPVTGTKDGYIGRVQEKNVQGDSDDAMQYTEFAFRKLTDDERVNYAERLGKEYMGQEYGLEERFIRTDPVENQKTDTGWKVTNLVSDKEEAIKYAVLNFTENFVAADRQVEMAKQKKLGETASREREYKQKQEQIAQAEKEKAQSFKDFTKDYLQVKTTNGDINVRVGTNATQTTPGIKYGDKLGIVKGRKGYHIVATKNGVIIGTDFATQNDAKIAAYGISKSNIDLDSDHPSPDDLKKSWAIGKAVNKQDYEDWAKLKDDIVAKPGNSSKPSTPELSPLAQKGKELVEKRKEEVNKEPVDKAETELPVPGNKEKNLKIAEKMLSKERIEFANVKPGNNEDFGRTIVNGKRQQSQLIEEKMTDVQKEYQDSLAMSAYQSLKKKIKSQPTDDYIHLMGEGIMIKTKAYVPKGQKDGGFIVTDNPVFNPNGLDKATGVYESGKKKGYSVLHKESGLKIIGGTKDEALAASFVLNKSADLTAADLLKFHRRDTTLLEQPDKLKGLGEIFSIIHNGRNGMSPGIIQEAIATTDISELDLDEKDIARYGDIIAEKMSGDSAKIVTQSKEKTKNVIRSEKTKGDRGKSFADKINNSQSWKKEILDTPTTGFKEGEIEYSSGWGQTTKGKILFTENEKFAIREMGHVQDNHYNRNPSYYVYATKNKNEPGVMLFGAYGTTTAKKIANFLEQTNFDYENVSDVEAIKNIVKPMNEIDWFSNQGDRTRYLDISNDDRKNHQANKKNKTQGENSSSNKRQDSTLSPKALRGKIAVNKWKRQKSLSGKSFAYQSSKY